MRYRVLCATPALVSRPAPSPTLRRGLALGLAAALAGSVFGPGALSAQARSYGQFERTLGQATTRVNQTLNLPLANGGKLMGILGREELQGVASGGAWRYTLSGWYEDKAYSSTVRRLAGPAVVANNGSSMSYRFGTQIVPESLAERVWEEGDVRKIREETVGEHRDVKVEFGREDGRFVIAAEVPYDGLGDEALEDRIVHLMMQSRHLLMAVEKGIQDSRGDLKDDLEDGRPTRMGAAEFEILIDRGLDEIRQTHPDAPEGFWAIARDDDSFRLYNKGDRIEMAAWDWTFPNVFPAMRGWMQAEVDAWLAGKKLEGATLSSRWDPHAYARFEVVATVTFDGTLQGKKIRDVYTKFLGDFGPEALKKFTDAEKKMAARFDEANALLFSEPLSELSWQNFNRLVPVLEPYHADVEGYREGWWNFKVGDVPMGFYLDGKRMEMTTWMEFPQADEAKRAALLAAAQEWTTQNPAPGSAATVAVWPPTNPILLWVKTQYPIDGSVTGEGFKQLALAYMNVHGAKVHQMLTGLKAGN